VKEAELEGLAREWFLELGYAYKAGSTLAPGEPGAERSSFSEVVLLGRLQAAILRLNPHLPAAAREEAWRKVLRVATPSLVQSNRAFHRMLRDGVEVEYQRPDGSIQGDKVRLIDFQDPTRNDWLVVDQFAVVEGHHHRRADLLMFLNGLPLGLIELKNAADEKATIWSAYKQLQTYKAQIPGLLQYNAVLVVSDGLQARIGSLTANQEWFKVWRAVDGAEAAPGSLELAVLIRGVFHPLIFLDLIQHFLAFEEDAETGALHKIVAGYHQLHAVNAAVEETVRASSISTDMAREEIGHYWAGRMHNGKPGDRRVGVIWHTQGSGKSFTMLFYAARIIREPFMQNPTLVVLTDRNDLDDQLFGQFQRCHDLLGQMPVQAANRENLRQLLAVASGGVVFTTIQKFLPEKGSQMRELSNRRNIVVIADEAHRSQYDLIDGLARHMRDALPNASFIGFTGTPIEKTDANTRAMFGDYISVYDIAARRRGQGHRADLLREAGSRNWASTREAPQSSTRNSRSSPRARRRSKRNAPRRSGRRSRHWSGPIKRLKMVAADLVDHWEARLGRRWTARRWWSA
jgi:type I restriction enzyme R subunit